MPLGGAMPLSFSTLMAIGSLLSRCDCHCYSTTRPVLHMATALNEDCMHHEGHEEHEGKNEISELRVLRAFAVKSIGWSALRLNAGQRLGAAGISLLARRKSITRASKPAGSSMLQACPVLGKILCTAPGISDAVFLPPAREPSYSPLMTSVGTFIVPRRGVMSRPPRARNICAMDSPDSQGSRSTNV